jgi:asparagine synthase (glutamine-hydrolysing)
MCGIGGIFLKQGESLDINRCLNDILTIQRHRGPDAHGVWLTEDQHLGLCHSRLAIIDLTEAGNQPMHSADSRFVIVFNGEIYNYKELRKELESKGAIFKSHTDTEVLLEAYRQWGENMLQRLRGMFSFGIYDRQVRLLFCARDPIGKKPFVYAETPKGFVFGSEISALLSIPGVDRKINRDALAGMLLHNVRHIVDPHTAYRGIKRLRSGHAMLVRGGHIEKIWQHWTPEPSVTEISPRRLQEIIEDAVKLRMAADAPVGAMLSGGVDSSAIVAIMARHSAEPIRTYAMGFNPADEDLRRARIMANHLGCIHKEFYFSADRQWEIFRKLIHTHGEPIMLLPLIHAFELCEGVREDGIKVVLGGHGADELFYGYTGHVRTARLSAVLKIAGPLFRSAASVMGETKGSPLLSMLASSPGERKAAYYRHCESRDWSSVLSQDAQPVIKNLVADELAYWGRICPSREFIDESNFCALMVENTHSVSISTDLPAMLASVEMRAPFLDREIINFALATPVDKKVPWIAPLTRLKWILRQAVRDLVPHDLLFAPKRGFGFGIPQDEVLRGPWRKHGDALFSNPNDADGLFDPKALRAEWEKYKQHGSYGSNLIPNMLAIQYWLQCETIAK